MSAFQLYRCQYFGARGERRDPFHFSDRPDPRASNPRPQTCGQPRARDSAKGGIQMIHELIDVDGMHFTDCNFATLLLSSGTWRRAAAWEMHHVECMDDGFTTLTLPLRLFQFASRIAERESRRWRCPREALTPQNNARTASARSRPNGRYGWRMEVGLSPHEIRSIAANAAFCAALVRNLTACTLQHDVTHSLQPR